MKKISYILRSEGFAFFVAALWAYSTLVTSWWWFALFLLVPDIFMVGYAKSSAFGATIYNIGHTYVAPLIVLLAFFFLKIPVLLIVAVIWFAHIAMDRMFGYGLKYDSGFKHTHLGVLGK